MGVGGFALGAAFTYLLDHPGTSPRFDEVKQRAKEVTRRAEEAVREVAQKGREVFSGPESTIQPSSLAGGRALSGIAGIGLLTLAVLLRNSVRAGIGLAALTLIWRSVTHRPTANLASPLPEKANASKNGASRGAPASLKCEDIMKRDAEGITPFDTLESAALRMRDENIGFMPVCDDSTKVIGTLTDRDLAIRALAEGKQPSAQIDEVYTRQLVCCSPQDEVSKAQELMEQNHVSRIVCVDGEGKLAGVISLWDIVEHLPAESAQTPRQVSEREAQAF